MFSSTRRAAARPTWLRRVLRAVLNCLRVIVIAFGALGPGLPPPPPPRIRETEQVLEDGEPDDK